MIRLRHWRWHRRLIRTAILSALLLVATLPGAALAVESTPAPTPSPTMTSGPPPITNTETPTEEPAPEPTAAGPATVRLANDQLSVLVGGMGLILFFAAALLTAQLRTAP